MSARRGERLGLSFALGLPLLVLLAVPTLALLAALAREGLGSGLASPQFRAALFTSLRTSTLALALIVGFGTPFAWWLARREGRLARVLDGLTQLPIVMPPAVVGLALLLALGTQSPLGAWLDARGWSPAFRSSAVVLAQVVVASPFYLGGARASFRRIDRRMLDVAATLGATPGQVFLRVTLPLALPGLAAAAAMAWARALGEFGATLIFAGNLPGRTQTMPLAIWETFDVDLDLALAASALLALVGALTLWLLRGLEGRGERMRGGSR